ncbi:hypothetical protein PPYR_00807 [Photinus pyralis]|uniref:Uncharacterized protein n=1 Tax=Photinus pyralis TaxID=7054 RepID=A0A5N4B2L1_PHOPY|nr:hypothetical protein PPYR_00807 [Photinus pyralis]
MDLFSQKNNIIISNRLKNCSCLKLKSAGHKILSGQCRYTSEERMPIVETATTIKEDVSVEMYTYPDFYNWFAARVTLETLLEGVLSKGNEENNNNKYSTQICNNHGIWCAHLTMGQGSSLVTSEKLSNLVH